VNLSSAGEFGYHVQSVIPNSPEEDKLGMDNVRGLLHFGKNLGNVELRVRSI